MEKLSMIIFHIILNTHVASFLKGMGEGGGRGGELTKQAKADK